MEKVFETAVYRRLSFVNELLGEVDPYNGGFLTGVCTTDNLVILQGLIQRQLILGKSLYVCFIDFSKAFDMINRNILFYKLMNGSWQGRVVHTLRHFYSKTNFFVVHATRECSQILNTSSAISAKCLTISSVWLYHRNIWSICNQLQMHVPGIALTALCTFSHLIILMMRMISFQLSVTYLLNTRCATYLKKYLSHLKWMTMTTLHIYVM